MLMLSGTENVDLSNYQWLCVAAVNQSALMNNLMKLGSLFLGTYWCVNSDISVIMFVFSETQA